MKPTIFIGSSSSALSLAQAIKRELSSDYRLEIWHEHLFELGEDTLNNLLCFVQCYDFAILVLTGDDFTKSRGSATRSASDIVVFELGLFMGALGRRRAFPIVAPSKHRSAKTPSDMLGNTAVFLPKGFGKKWTAAALREELTRLKDTLKARSEESNLQHLPSTALAIGYFQNFVLPVCKALAGRKTVSVRGRRMEIRPDNFDFTVVLPKTLSAASIEGAKKFCKAQQVVGFKLRTGERSYPFYVGTSLKSGRLGFYDFPTTLRAAHECVRLAFAGPYLGSGRHRAMLDEREIRNFERTLRFLLGEASAKEFRENVNIVHAP